MVRDTKKKLVYALWPILAWGQRPVVPHMQVISTLDGTPMLEAGLPAASRPYLGLLLQDQKAESGEARCLVFVLRPGPVREALGTGARGSFILLSANGREIHTSAEFRQFMEGVSAGSEVRLRFLRTSPKPETETSLAVRVATWADWAAPIDFAHPPRVRLAPEQVVPAGAGPTSFERFMEEQFSRHRLDSAVAATRKHILGAMEANYSPNILSRVAYGFYRPTRLAELQTIITDPLVSAVDRHKDNPLSAAQPLLAEAAKNLDVRFTAAQQERIDIANPRQALRDAAGMVGRAHTHLDRAFSQLDSAARKNLHSYARGLLEPDRFGEQPVVRARQASMAIDYGSLLAAADALVAWSAPDGPPQQQKVPLAAIPSELKSAVKGDILAAERIDGGWFVYGGFGSNEYDMSLIDVVIDPAGDDIYRYPGNARPSVQLILDWAGNDRYLGENGAAGPASGLLGVSVLIDRAGEDRYSGGNLSCGGGLMGVGLLMDLGGNDSYQAVEWSLAHFLRHYRCSGG
ncbi:MAG: hypothetical protein J0L64_07780 [Acidobacteria bacterium]|nr:hypothetical protein [Acidobacteriota bacterium]